MRMARTYYSIKAAPARTPPTAITNPKTPLNDGPIAVPALLEVVAAAADEEAGDETAEPDELGAGTVELPELAALDEVTEPDTAGDEEVATLAEEAPLEAAELAAVLVRKVAPLTEERRQ